MKTIILLSLIVFAIISCEKKTSSVFDSRQESIESMLERFPMIDRNMKQARQINLDSLSITLLKNSSKVDYDEIIVFEKRGKFRSIPFFSNMYFDYWGFQNEKQLQLYKKTNSTFEEELKKVVHDLQLTPDEFRIILDELMLSLLTTEINLCFKPKIFENFVYSTERVDKYKIEESEFCIERTKKIFDEIKKDSEKTMRYERWFLDSKNGRVYKIINTPHLGEKLNFHVKVYRIDCFSYPLNI